MVCGAPGDPTTRGRGEKAARYCLTHDELCGDEGLFKLWRHSFGELRGRAREAAGRAFIVAAGLEGPTLWHRTKRRDL
jgi:hypothetical protein